MKGFNFLLSILLLLPLMNIFGQVNQKNIIINEVSQGSGAGTDEWIELRVTADGTDIRGVYVDVDHGTNTLGDNIAFELSTSNADFASVDAGSIIVIYNSIVTKDSNIGPIDTDFSDGTLLIPSNNTTFLSTTGWKTSVAAGDAIGLFNPNDGSVQGIMAIAWGNYTGFPTGNFSNGWDYAVYTSPLTTNTGLYYNGSTASGVSNASNWIVEDDVNNTAGTSNLAPSYVNRKNIIINELSQGSGTGSGTDEWIELLVTEDGTNIQGVYIDADKGAGNLGANIAFELSTTLPAFANVNKGSIIVVYNSGEKSPNLGPDDIDFSDGKILIPSNNTTFLSTTGWETSFYSADAIGLFNPNDGSIEGIMAIGWGNYSLIPTANFSQGWGTAVYSSSLSGTQGLYFRGGTTSGVTVVSNWMVEADDSSTPEVTNGGLNDALPVELTSFSALISKNSVNLIWKTETEVNNYGFEIQRSIQSEDWKTLGFVNGNGNSNSPKDYSFTDNSVGTSGKYSYRLKQIDNDGSYEYSKSIEVNLGAPASIELRQNYPNPFNPSTTINFTLPVEDAVSLIVYNAIGEQVKVLYSGVLEAGVHSFNFSGDDLPSGLYVYKLSTSAGNQIRKMMLVK